MWRTADRLDAALRGEVVERCRAALAVGPRRRPSRIAHRGGRRAWQAPPPSPRHRRDPPHASADGGPVAGRAPRARHRAGAAPSRPASRSAHGAVVRPGSSPRDARPRPHEPRGRPRRPPGTRRARPGLGRPPRRRTRHGIPGVRRRRAPRPTGARRRRHVLGERDPLPRGDPALDTGRQVEHPSGCFALLRRLHRLMDVARRTGWQASTGVRRSGEEAYVHARSGRPCRRCGDTVRVATTGAAPRQRTLFSCPTCQKGLAPTDDGRPQRPLGSRRTRSVPRLTVTAGRRVRTSSGSGGRDASTGTSRTDGERHRAPRGSRPARPAR